jgi:hypothetical protein
MSRLPTPGSDTGSWGTVLNDFLSVSLTNGGLLKAGTVATTNITDGVVTKAKLETSVQTSLTRADAAPTIITLGPTDPVPGGTVAGTIILRTT